MCFLYEAHISSHFVHLSQGHGSFLGDVKAVNVPAKYLQEADVLSVPICSNASERPRGAGVSVSGHLLGLSCRFSLR